MGIRLRGGLALVALGLGLAGGIFAAREAQGKSAYDSPYGYERTWTAALRLVRVDLGLKLLEKDEKSGYLLFEYKETAGQRTASSGSLELIRGSSATRPDDVRVVAQLPALPAYHEQVLLDELSRKMHADYGDPPEPRTPVAPVADAGSDGHDENEP